MMDVLDVTAKVENVKASIAPKKKFAFSKRSKEGTRANVVNESQEPAAKNDAPPGADIAPPRCPMLSLARVSGAFDSQGRKPKCMLMLPD